MKEKPLWYLIAFVPRYTETCKDVGYVGFPVRELVERMRELVKRFGARDFSWAFQDLLTFTGNRVMLNAKARDLCWQLLGPPPEKWSSFYTHPDGSPSPRPLGRETLPVIPEREIDPITDGLRLLAPGQLEELLVKARKTARGTIKAWAELGAEQIQCIESEMLRRGMEIPPEEVPKKEKPKKKASKKK